MKKYFAKYLPVEGQIEEGSWYYNPYLDVYHQHQVDKGIMGPILGAYKVKLFLCSRDIQVGDECYHQKYPEIGKCAVKEGDAEDCVDWHGENVDAVHLCKVIGEISPKATWVKEGDKFDEDEIFRTETERDYNPVDDKIEYYTNRIKGSVPKKEGKQYSYRPIKIKGPCGHFH